MTQTIVGASAPIVKMREQIATYAPSSLPVLILGETGTGKDLAARALHDLSPRAHRPYVAVNCGAFTAEMIDAELFGHVRGAFTGATMSRPGLVRAADGGTLFLDEIGDMSTALQCRLLRLLETGEVRPVGSDATTRANVRVIAATHCDPSVFRSDLLYRLRTLEIAIPPLRERPEDIDELLEHFAAGRLTFAADAREAIAAHPWPGNVRELRSLVERLTVEHPPGHCVTAGDLPQPADASYRGPQSGDPSGMRGTLRDLERRLIREAMQRHGGNLTAAARTLGTKRTTLFRRVCRLGLRAERERATRT